MCILSIIFSLKSGDCSSGASPMGRFEKNMIKHPARALPRKDRWVIPVGRSPMTIIM